jgi:hypothetical protein
LKCRDWILRFAAIKVLTTLPVCPANTQATRQKNERPTALYIPCSSCSLNLFGNNAAEFFNFFQKVYVFLSAPTHMLSVLKSPLQQEKMMKKLTIQSGLQESIPFWL